MGLKPRSLLRGSLLLFTSVMIVQTIGMAQTPPAEPPLVQVLDEAFLNATNPDWILRDGWQLVASEADYALQGSNDTLMANYLAQTFEDVVVSARIQSTKSAIELHVRQADVTGYSLHLTPAGDVSLLRNDTVLGTASVSGSTNNQWREIRLSAIGDTVRASVDGVEVIVATDAQPLGAGFVGFTGRSASNGNGTKTVLVDDMQIWQSTSLLIEPGEWQSNLLDENTAPILANGDNIPAQTQSAMSASIQSTDPQIILVADFDPNSVPPGVIEIESTVITFTTQVAGFDSQRNYTPPPAEQQISIRYMAQLDYIYGYPVEKTNPSQDDNFAAECVQPFASTTGDSFPARLEAGRGSGNNAATFGVSGGYTLYVTFIEADRDINGNVTGLASLKWVTATFTLGDEINTVTPPVQRLSAFGVVWPANQYPWVPNPTLDFDFLLPNLTNTSQC